MRTSTDPGSQLLQARRQLERAELYVVAARELAGPGSEAGLAIEKLREALLEVEGELRPPPRTATGGRL